MNRFQRLALIFFLIFTSFDGRGVPGQDQRLAGIQSPTPVIKVEKVEIVSPPDSSISKWLPIVLSASAFLFSIISVVVIYFWKAKIKIVLGDHIRMFVTHDDL